MGEDNTSEGTGETETGTESDTDGDGPRCGNGQVDPGEDCDDGNSDELDACTNTCELPGSVRWEDLFDGPASGGDWVADVAVDPHLHVYSLGWVQTTTSLNSDDIWLRKFDESGHALWTQTFDGVALQYTERGDAIAVAPNGDVVFAAVDRESYDNDGVNVRLVRLDPEGEVQWDIVYEGSAGLLDAATDLAIREDGEIFVAGTQYLDTTSDAWVAHFGADGALQAERFFDSGGNQSERFAGIAIMPDGGLAVVGRSVVAPPNGNAWILRLDPNLETVWETFAAGDGDGDAAADSVAVTPNGLVVVGGSRFRASRDAWLVRFDDSGQEVWSWHRDGQRNGIDFTTAVAVDSDGNITVAGIERNTPDGATSPFLVKLDEGGDEVWSFANDALELPTSRFIESMVVGPDHSIVLGGVEQIVSNESYLAWTQVHAP